MYIVCSIVLYNNYHNVLEFTHRGNIDVFLFGGLAVLDSNRQIK